MNSHSYTTGTATKLLMANGGSRQESYTVYDISMVILF